MKIIKGKSSLEYFIKFLEENEVVKKEGFSYYTEIDVEEIKKEVRIATITEIEEIINDRVEDINLAGIHNRLDEGFVDALYNFQRLLVKLKEVEP